MTGDEGTGHTRLERVLRQWENGRTPADGPPDDELIAVFWQDADGHEVTDEATIAELTARYAARERT